MERVRLGIIGIGNMGSAHSKSIYEGNVPELVLTAVADLKESRRSWARETFGDSVAVFSNAEELLGSGMTDAVLVATPHYEHPRLVKEALRRGLHVMSEKPAGVYTKAVRDMNEEAAKHSDLVFAMMFNQRTNCIYRKMHELVVGGTYGQIKRVNWIITDWYRPQIYYDSGDWRATWDGEGGGVLLNQCPHQLDLLQWICGMPSRVQAFCHEGKWHQIEVEDDVTAYLEYPNGATGVFITSTGDAPGTNRFEVDLEMAKIVCENDRISVFELEENDRDFCVRTTEGFSQPKGQWIDVETDGKNEQHTGVLKAFAAAVLRGEPLVARGEEGIRGLTLSNAMHLSGWLKKPVDLPFDEELFLEELNKRRATSDRKTNLKETTFEIS
ncbi:MAG: Gfo/Idh/MocA family oxidoreductase [Clostridiales bacterium]|nr:Gfo/Idh/MocA family oxidoreductase [Clostridiales bacterium]